MTAARGYVVLDSKTLNTLAINAQQNVYNELEKQTKALDADAEEKLTRLRTVSWWGRRWDSWPRSESDVRDGLKRGLRDEQRLYNLRSEDIRPYLVAVRHADYVSVSVRDLEFLETWSKPHV
jgi:hypothetical protein